MADIRGLHGPIEPLGEMRFEAYYGLVMATPLGRCSGCDMVVLYRTSAGQIMTAEHCRCTESDDA